MLWIGLAVLLGLFVFFAPQAFLLMFAGALFAIFLDALTSFFERLGLSHGWSLALVITLLLAVACLGGWLIFPQLSAQFARLAEELPRSLEQLRNQLAQNDAGQWLLKMSFRWENSYLTGSALSSRLSTFLSSTLGVLTGALVIFFLGIFLASEPRRYRSGITCLFPPEHRDRICEVLLTLGRVLRYWLLGRLILMFTNGVVTAIGLWLLGVPLALALGIIAALLNFIPNFGPIIAAIPAILVALLKSPESALYVTIFYLAYQMFDGYVLTPLVQRRAAEIPPAVTISSQVIFGILLGLLGVLLAVPLAATVLVLVKMLYLQDTLGQAIHLPGDGEKKPEQNGEDDKGS